MPRDIEKLLKIAAKLRSKNGCPWDRGQTHNSLKPYLLEETYEVIEAIDKKNNEKLCEELGDLLLQVVLHAQLAKEKKKFTFSDVIKSISRKMVERHPHVFGKIRVKNIAEVWHNWEEIKNKKKNKNPNWGDIPKSIPSLSRAQIVQQRALRFGFTNFSPRQLFSKIQIELKLLEDNIASKSKNAKKTKERLGKLFFFLSDLGRILNIEAEPALQSSINTFLKSAKASSL